MASEKTKRIFSYAILIILLLLVLAEFIGNSLNFIQPYLNIILLIMAATAIFLFKDKIIRAFNKEKESDEKTKGWKNEIPYLIILVIILALFFYVKLPYMNYTLTSDKFIKYQDYAEPAISMAQTGNLNSFHYFYLANPLNNSDVTSINHLPIFEYGLLLTYKLLPGNSLEFNTHLLSFLLGAILLISIYLLSKEFLPRKFSLILSLVLALSPIIQFSSFLTVGDTPMLALLFFSLLTFKKHLKNNSKTLLITSSILLSLSILTKVTAVLIAIPILIIIFAKNKQNSAKIINYIVFTIFIVGVFLLFLRNYMSNFLISLVSLIISLIILIWLFLKSKQFENKIEKSLDTITKTRGRKIISAIALLIILGIIYYLLYNSYLGYSLTNSYSILNFKMYSYLINNLISNLTPEIFYPSLLGIIFFISTIKKQKSPQFILSVLATALIYFILLSRVLFFHEYYQIIIVLALSLGFVYFVYAISGIFEDKILSWIALTLFLLLVLPASFSASQKILDQQASEAPLAAKYLAEHLSKDQFFLSGGSAQALSLYSGRNQVPLYNLKNNDITNEIRAKGFTTAMISLNITYFVTTSNQPEYTRLIALFDKKFLEIDPDRDSIIAYLLGDKQFTYSEFEKRQIISETLNLPSHFILEKQIGKYKFFRIV